MIGETDEFLLNELQDERIVQSDVAQTPKNEESTKKKKKVRFNLPELAEVKKVSDFQHNISGENRDIS